MKKTLTFDVAIAAPRHRVWETMLGADTYREWTAPFCEGTYYEGSWDAGSKIHFLAPNGDGMVAEIAENRQHEFVSIRHLGEVKGGVEDTTSAAVQTWAPAHENFSFADSSEGTTVTVELEILPDFEAYMRATYPKALEVLKKLCEADRADS